MKQDKTIYQRLEDLRQKGIGWHSTPAADKMMDSLRFLLTHLEWVALYEAQKKYKNGEGAGPFNDQLNKLINKYRQAPASPIKKTLL